MEKILGPFPRAIFRNGGRYKEFKRFARGQWDWSYVFDPTFKCTPNALVNFTQRPFWWDFSLICRSAGEPYTIHQQRENLQAELNTMDFHFVDFVHRCLLINPRERINPEEVRNRSANDRWLLCGMVIAQPVYRNARNRRCGPPHFGPPPPTAQLGLNRDMKFFMEAQVKVTRKIITNQSDF